MTGFSNTIIDCNEGTREDYEGIFEEDDNHEYLIEGLTLDNWEEMLCKVMDDEYYEKDTIMFIKRLLKLKEVHQ